MASSSMVVFSRFLPISATLFPKTNNKTLKSLNLIGHSRFLSSNSISLLRSKILRPKFPIRTRLTRSHSPVVISLQSNFFRVVQTVLKVGKDGIEAGTNLVPDSVPRPVARVSVTVAAGFLTLFVLQSFVSTALFALGVMGFIYFIYLALNKDKGPKVDETPKSSDDAVEEARRIMDKYK